jgi:hypothetical protein
MRSIRVTLECGRPHSTTREWFSTIFVLSEEEIARGEHIAIAKYRARIQGYVEPFEVFDPSANRNLPSPRDLNAASALTNAQPNVATSAPLAREDGESGGPLAASETRGVSRVRR